MMYQWLPLALLLAGSAFFSSSETAFFNLSAHQRQQLQAGRAGPGALAARLLQHPERLLLTLLLGNLAVNVLYFAVSSVVVIDLSRRLPGWGTALAGLTPLLAILFFGEVLPKTVALSRPTWIATTFAPPIWVIDRLLAPIGHVLNAAFVRPACRLLSPAPASAGATVSHEELREAVETSARRGLIEREVGRLLREVVALHTIPVREVMVPRVDLDAFDLGQTREQFLELVRRTGLKRVPAYRGDLDHIVGVIEVRRVLVEPDRPLETLVETIHIVPDVIHIEHLLAEFRRAGRQTALVVDEYGGTAGLVTLEDVVEEIVGDIYDPADLPETPIRSIADDEYLVSGDLSIREWTEVLRAADFNPAVLRLQPLGQTMHTIGGLLAALLGRAPRVGDVVRLRNLSLTVEEVQRRRVTWVRILREDDAQLQRDTHVRSSRSNMTGEG
jgi:putative hemolysin